MLEIDPSKSAKDFGDKMRHGPSRRATEICVLRVCFTPGNKVAERLHAGRHHRPNRKTEVEPNGLRNRLKISNRVIGELLVSVRVDSQHRHRRDHQGQPIRRGGLQSRQRDLPPGPSPIFNNERLRDDVTQFVGDAARGDVDRATRSETRKDANALGQRLRL